MAAPPIQLLASYDDEDRICVEIYPSKTRVYSLEELREHLPDTATLQGYGPLHAMQLADAIMHLSNGTQGQLYSSPETLQELLPAAYNAETLDAVERWYRDGSLRLPTPEDLKAPHWQGDDLVFVGLDLHYSMGMPLFFAERYASDFATSPLSVTRESLATPADAGGKTRETVAQAFGGDPAAVARITSEDGASYLFAALDSPPGVARFVVKDARAADSESQRFDTWQDLSNAHPDFASAPALSKLADALHGLIAQKHIQEGSYRVIADADAYRNDYRTQGWSTFKLRYWVDQIAETHFHVANLDQIAVPRVEGSRLRAYFLGPRNQPFIWDVDLQTLTLDTSPELQAMATEELVSDSGGYFGKSIMAAPRSSDMPPPPSDIIDSDREE